MGAWNDPHKSLWRSTGGFWKPKPGVSYQPQARMEGDVKQSSAVSEARGATRLFQALGKGEAGYLCPLPSLLRQTSPYRCQCLSQDAHTRSLRGRQRGAEAGFVWAGISLGLVLSATRPRSPRGARGCPCGALITPVMNRPFQPRSPWAAKLYLRPRGRKSRKQLKAFLSLPVL